MTNMFKGTLLFNAAIPTGTGTGNTDHWKVDKVKKMESMFESAGEFSQSVNGWAVTSVTDFTSMFKSAAKFNGDIFEAATAANAVMISMFENADAYVGGANIAKLDTSKVTDMTNMFKGTLLFNAAIATGTGTGNTDHWKVDKVKKMESMFESAGEFSQSVGTWAVTAVTDF